VAKLSQKTELKQQLSPQQVLHANILQLNVAQLEQRILDELEENPVLELTEIEEKESPEENSDEPQSEDDELSEIDEKEEETDFDWEEILGDPDAFDYKIPSEKPEADREIPIKASRSFNEKLLDQYRDLNPSDAKCKIAEELIGNIDDDGYLTVEPILISDRFRIAENEVLKVLKDIQNLDPPGLGSRDLRECLLAQLNRYGSNQLAREVLDKYFDDFANRRYNKIMDALSCNENELNEAMNVISQLNPKPGSSILGSGEEKDFIIPDLTVRENDGKWCVFVNDPTLPELRISQKYKNMLVEYGKQADVRQFIRQKMDSAKWFIDAVEQRKLTMVRVMESIIKRQTKFFGKSEKRELIPMILKDVADDIQVDISTVSRISNRKYVQLPFGIYELKEFFSEGIKTESGEEVSNTVVKDMLKNIIHTEDKKNPLGDEELTQLLNEKGYKVARRTVTKYREQLKYPVARLRKSL